MHEIGCVRMNYWCAKCNTLVAKADKESHDLECGKPKVEPKPIPVSVPAPVVSNPASSALLAAEEQKEGIGSSLLGGGSSMPAMPQ